MFGELVQLLQQVVSKLGDILGELRAIHKLLKERDKNCVYGLSPSPKKKES